MKSLMLALMALMIAHHAMRDTRPQRSPQRSPAEQKAWASWYDLHPNGGGV